VTLVAPTASYEGYAYASGVERSPPEYSLAVINGRRGAIPRHVGFRRVADLSAQAATRARGACAHPATQTRNRQGSTIRRSARATQWPSAW